MKKKIKRILSALSTVLLIITSLVCLVLVAKATMGKDTSLFGFRVFYIITGSMEPEIPVESLIIVHRQPDYAENDIITFLSNDESIKGSPNTHRIIAVRTEGDKKYYRTKGDANTIPDDGEVTSDNIYGKVVYKSGRAAWIGKIIPFFVTPAGFMTIVGLPLVLLAGAAMKDCIKALKENAMQQALEAAKAQQMPTDSPEGTKNGNDSDNSSDGSGLTGPDIPENKETDEKEER